MTEELQTPVESETDTSTEQEETLQERIARQENALDRARAGNQPTEIINILEERLATLKNKQKLEDPVSNSLNVHDNYQDWIDNAEHDTDQIRRSNTYKTPAFIGVDKYGTAADRERFNELLGIANELFNEEYNEEGDVVGLVVNKDANIDEIYDKYDSWYRDYRDEFGDSLEEFEQKDQLKLEEKKKYVILVLQFKAMITRAKSLYFIDSYNEKLLAELNTDINAFLTKGPENITKSEAENLEKRINEINFSKNLVR